MVFLGVAHAAMREDGAFAGVVAGFGGEVFGGVGFSAAGPVLVVEPGGLVHHQVGGFELHPGLGQRVLYALVLPDGAAKHLPLAGIAGGPRERGAAQAHGLAGDQDALGVQAVQDVAKALALLAHQVLLGDAQPVDEDLVGVHAFAAELFDLAHLHGAAVHV